jgi:hypothetical protein
MPRTKQIHLDSDLFAEPNSKEKDIHSLYYFLRRVSCLSIRRWPKAGRTFFTNLLTFIISPYWHKITHDDDHEFTFFIWIHWHKITRQHRKYCINNILGYCSLSWRCADYNTACSYQKINYLHMWFLLWTASNFLDVKNFRHNISFKSWRCFLDMT